METTAGVQRQSGFICSAADNLPKSDDDDDDDEEVMLNVLRCRLTY